MKIDYVTGSRADFGLMRACLEAIQRQAHHDLGIIVTGQHMLVRYGNTLQDIRDSGLKVRAEIPVHLSGADGAEMGRALAAELVGFIQAWQVSAPDLVIVLGDRGEMLAATLAAIHLGIFVAHIHGGELSGTIDESFRHSISKLAHFHLVSSEDAAQRLRKMGEMPGAIYVIGAPGLVGIADGVQRDRQWFFRRFGFSPEQRTALVLFHPVVQEAASAGVQVRALVSTLADLGLCQVLLRPNSDAGGQAIDAYLDTVAGSSTIRVERHLDRASYLKALASCDVLVGNSSSGIIESASFGIPCINIGTRQQGRLRNRNTFDVPDSSKGALEMAVRQAQAFTGPFDNLYGSGDADRRLLAVLDQLCLDKVILAKRNAY